MDQNISIHFFPHFSTLNVIIRRVTLSFFIDRSSDQTLKFKFASKGESFTLRNRMVIILFIALRKLGKKMFFFIKKRSE